MFASKTTDSGLNWTRYYLSPVGYTYAIAVDPSNSDIVYAGGNPGLFKTTNAGTNWIDISSGLTGYVYAIAINPDITSTIFAGTPNGVFKSTNSGVEWTNIGCTGVNALLIDPNGTDTIYAGTDNGVFKSITGGGNWTAVNQGFEDSTVLCLGMYPNNYLFAGTHGAGMYRWNLNVGIEAYYLRNNNELAIYAKPNPFTTKTKICYTLARQTTVAIIIYDVQGRLVRNLFQNRQSPGTYGVSWNGCDDKGNAVPSGIYLYKCCLDESECIRKLILLK